MMASSLFSCISECKQQDVHVYEKEEHGAAILQYELRGLLTTTNRCLCLMAQSSKVSFNSTSFRCVAHAVSHCATKCHIDKGEQVDKGTAVLVASLCMSIL